jgi:hypothetical protein
METVGPVASWVAATGLGGAGAIHALWATGSSWPAASRDELADLVVGRRPMPGGAACAAVAASLAAAAGATAYASGGHRRPLVDRSRQAAGVVAVVLLIRGVGGALADVVGVGDAAPRFRTWNRRLYNPLCIVLGVLVAMSRRHAEPAATD